MANIRVDNFSGDMITVFLDDRKQDIEEDGRFTFDSLEKGKHTLRIHRTRVPLEIIGYYDEQEKSPQEKIEETEKSMHVNLDYVTEAELNSSKGIITVRSDVTAKEGKGLDAIFSSYSVTATGAEIRNGFNIFANSSVKKRFISHHIKNALFPTGMCGMVILVVALISLLAALSGSPINLGGTVFTLPWAAGLSAVALAVCAYSLFCIANVMKTAKRLWQNSLATD